MERLSRQKRRAGFSLIEVNMAIFVLAGGALALLGLFPLGLRESLASRNEMRVAAFAERFMGAARIAAADPDVTDVDSLANALESGTFGFRVDADPGESDADNAVQDSTSGVWYRAWLMNDTSYTGIKNGNSGKEVAQIGIQVTAEDGRQNKRAIRSAPVYVVRVLVDTKNKQ